MRRAYRLLVALPFVLAGMAAVVALADAAHASGISRPTWLIGLCAIQLVPTAAVAWALFPTTAGESSDPSEFSPDLPGWDDGSAWLVPIAVQRTAAEWTAL